MLCGHRFCWVCREPWDIGCGFFRCRLAVEEPAAKDSDDRWEKAPEEWDNHDAQGAADQVEGLDIALGEPPHSGSGQGDTGALRRRRRSEDFSAGISEKVCALSPLLLLWAALDSNEWK